MNAITAIYFKYKMGIIIFFWWYFLNLGLQKFDNYN